MNQTLATKLLKVMESLANIGLNSAGAAKGAGGGPAGAAAGPQRGLARGNCGRCPKTGLPLR